MRWQSLLIHFHRIDGPVSIREGSRISSNVILTGWCQACTRARAPHTASPVTAERGINDNFIVPKVCINIATSITIECHDRKTPITGHGSVVGNILRDLSALEEPYVYTGRLPLHSIYTTANTIEARAVAVCVGGPDCTASISVPCIAIRGNSCGSRLRPGIIDDTAR